MKVTALIFALLTIATYANGEFIPKPFDVLPLINIPRMTFLYTTGDWYLTKYGHEDDTYRCEYVEVMEPHENEPQEYKIVGWYIPTESENVLIYAGTNIKGLDVLGREDKSAVDDETDPRILAKKYGWL